MSADQNDALALTEVDQLTYPEAAVHMKMTVDEFESLLLAAWLRLEHD
ncbi:hypothetical protein [Actinomycetospora soli]|nr:hypothetical protein [Actinomycetospora soli]MCD2191235.1 hypothetical protein [Actinomycetospora soli]